MTLFVGGDIVLCKCSAPARIIAVYGQRWKIHDNGDTQRQVVRASTPASQATYDEQFTLTDAAGKALRDTYYTVRLPSGELIHGITDAQGRTSRHTTDGA
ncbi:hypothetical protein BN2475_460004 [Paraburkholderia ribeironis]|uniref:Uncharacterized protein n=1 Tax=Paraburkholderia ribeironis TaxID=1247936 RepID=A0A1N7S9C8_9BURK|nr:hypothetical protein [Paraburkholderia ribeironis]SIT43996.1 hypothetical protein BN2475_460004 [Paraburkholderia ribeironis]